MIRRLLKYWLLVSFLEGAVVFLYGVVFLSTDCRECPAIYFILGLMTGVWAMLVNLGLFLLLIPVHNKPARVILSAVLCLLPALLGRILLLKNVPMSLPEEFIKPILITALCCGCYIFIRTTLNKKTSIS